MIFLTNKSCYIWKFAEKSVFLPPNYNDMRIKILLVTLLCMYVQGTWSAENNSSDDYLQYQLFVWMKNGEKTGYLSSDKPEIRLDGENVKFSTVSVELYIMKDDLEKFTLEQIKPEDPTDISIDSKLELEVGQQKRVLYTLTPADAQTTVKWLNSNPEVIDVSPYGWVRGLKEGTAVLKAQTSNGLRAECQVTVPEPNYVLYVWLIDGRIIGYPAKDKPQVLVGDDMFTLTTNSTEIGYPSENVLKFTFEDSSVDNPITEIVLPTVTETQMNYDAGCMRLTGLNPLSKVSVYDIQGRLMTTQKADAEGNLSISFGQYPAGIYAVKTEKSNYKILKK